MARATEHPGSPRDSPSERLSRADYFKVAMRLLAEGGIKAVTIASVCERLAITKGSFYHHFGNVQDFHASLLEHWEKDLAQGTFLSLKTVGSPRERLAVLKSLAVRTDHEAESAIRAWARTDPRAAECQQRVDEAREATLVRAFIDAGVEARQAPVLARIGLTILVGTQQIEERVDRRRLGRLLDGYQEWLEASSRPTVAKRARRP